MPSASSSSHSRSSGVRRRVTEEIEGRFLCERSPLHGSLSLSNRSNRHGEGSHWSGTN